VRLPHAPSTRVHPARTLAAARARTLGSNARLRTARKVPLSVCRSGQSSAPALVSYSRTASSSPPAASVAPSAVKASARTGSVKRATSASSAPSGYENSRTWPSSQPVAKRAVARAAASAFTPESWCPTTAASPSTGASVAASRSCTVQSAPHVTKCSCAPSSEDRCTTSPLPVRCADSHCSASGSPVRPMAGGARQAGGKGRTQDLLTTRARTHGAF
jgi:hypothetical protein